MKASELKNLDVRELIDELNSLDFENVGGWPMPVKIGAAVLVFGFVLGLGYFLSIKDLNTRHEQLQREEDPAHDTSRCSPPQSETCSRVRQTLVGGGPGGVVRCAVWARRAMSARSRCGLC